MSDKLKILELIELPKVITERGFDLLERLMGPSIDEFGSLFGESLRIRRLKNQLIILSKAKKIAEEAGLNLRALNLKELVPLLEYSSLEENKDLQELWSQLIANVASDLSEDFGPAMFRTLKELTQIEALVLKDLTARGGIEEYFEIETIKNHPEEIRISIMSHLSSLGLIRQSILPITGGEGFQILDTTYELSGYGQYFMKNCTETLR